MSKENEKQLTAMKELISYQANLIKEQGHKLSAYEILNMVSTKAVELLATERQQLIDFGSECMAEIEGQEVNSDFKHLSKRIYNETFKTQ